MTGLPGTALKHLLESIGISPKSGCPCEDLAGRMDKWGVQGCLERKTRIASSLREHQTKWSWPEKWAAGLSAVANGLAFKLARYPLNPFLGLVEEAIEQSPKHTVPFARTDRRLRGVDPNAKLTPLPAEIADSRNLIYHIWPVKKTDHWRWNVRELLKRIDLFNGVRTIGIAIDGNTVTAAEVQAEFAGVRIDHWIVRPNNPKAGEGATFLEMMATLPRDQSVTCYAHAKGVKYEQGNTTPVKWAELLYRSTLDNWPMVRNALRDFPVVGTFKRYGHYRLPQNHGWHYSGTFFWFRNGETFLRSGWSHLQKSLYGCVEVWPANVYKATEAACLLGDNAGNLYDPNEIAKHDRDLTFREAVFAADKRSDLGSGVSDAVYYGGSIRLGYTEWHWPALVETHQRGASFIRHELGCDTVLELGSGLGAFLVGAKNAGLTATGMDVNGLERGFALSKGIAAADYELGAISTYQITKQVDCIYTAEVFEHCTDAELDPICRQLAANCKWFYFTSTPHATTAEADAAWGHVNLKSREQWIAFFSRYGLEWDRDDKSVVEWGLVFRVADWALSRVE